MSYNEKVPALLDAFCRKLSTKATKVTAENYKSDIMMFFKFLIMVKHEFKSIKNVSAERVYNEMKDAQIIAVTSDDVEAFASYLKYDRENKENSVKRRLMAIQKFYNYLKTKEGLIEKLPTEGVMEDYGYGEKKTPRFLVQDEWERLLDATERESNEREKERNLCIITFLLHLGLRRGEIEGLDIGDVKISKDRSYVLIHGKGNKERVIPLDDACINAFRKHMEKRNKAATEHDSYALFLSKRGTRLTASSIYKMVKRMCKAAGLSSDITTHSLRHTFGTNSIRVGSINQVQKLMGHTSITTTTIYTHISDEGLDDIIKNSPINNEHQYEFEDIKEVGNGDGKEGEQKK